MNFLNLHYYTVVADELNITKAAERLYISQQSLSNHILNLEKELGIMLFTRTPSLSLTYAGKRVLRSALQILDIKRQMINEIDDINNQKRGELRIGISHTRGRVFLPKVLPTFHKERPLIDVSIKEGNSEQLEDWLRHGHIDLLISFSPILLNEAETIDLLKERLILVVPYKFMINLFPENHEEMTKKFSSGVDAAVFQNCPYLMMTTGNRIRTLFDQYIKHIGISIKILLETESIETLLSLACEEMGITVYPEMFVKNLSPLLTVATDSLVRFFPINDPSTIGNLVIAYYRDRYLSDAAKLFIQECTKVEQLYTP